jgi:hypothetical protein
MAEWRYCALTCSTSAIDDGVSFMLMQLYIQRKSPRYPLAPEPVCMPWSREKSFAPGRNLILAMQSLAHCYTNCVTAVCCDSTGPHSCVKVRLRLITCGTKTCLCCFVRWIIMTILFHHGGCMLYNIQYCKVTILNFLTLAEVAKLIIKMHNYKSYIYIHNTSVIAYNKT